MNSYRGKFKTDRRAGNSNLIGSSVYGGRYSDDTNTMMKKTIHRFSKIRMKYWNAS